MSAPAPLAMVCDGVTDLPAGMFAACTTYLDITARPPARPAPERPDLALRRIDRPDPDAYRALYRAVGQDLLWFSRLAMTDAELAAILQDPAVWVFEASAAGRAIGLVEFDARDGRGGATDDVELAFFGLVPEAVGTGAGRWVMNRALDIAFSVPVRRIWVHTCQFDHPAALDFYRRSGFTPYKVAVELGTDPRLTGTLPRSAAPQIPLIEPRS